MRQTVAWSVLAAIPLMCAACSNSDMSSAMTPIGSGGTTGVAAGTTAPVPTGTAGTPGTTTGTAGSSPIGAAGSPPATTAGTGAVATGGTGGATMSMTGTAGAPVTPPNGTAGMAAAGAGGSGAVAGAGAAGEAAPGGFKPPCLAKGAELALVGDSWINYVLGQLLAPALQSRAQKDGALAAGDAYNDQAVGGTSLASGGLGLIPDQWPTAKAAAMRAGSTVKFVIMDGGGNDVLLGNQTCLDNGVMRDKDPSCQKTVQDATAAGAKLQMQMKADGVKQALYFFYPHVPAGGWDVLDYSLPMAKATCESMNDANYHCTFVDTRDAFQGAGNTGVAMANLIGADGIHPSAAGEAVLADLIWKTMKDNCMAQNASSGCCTP
jgi:lysophospholipase L1-like esterase